MTPEQVRLELRNTIKIETVYPPITGGQSVGNFQSKIRLYSEELDLTIITGYYKANLKNRDLAIELFSKALELIVK